MKDFYKRLWRLLFLTLFLLLAAWVGMKLMQHHWDLESIMEDAKKTMEKFSGDFVELFQDKIAPTIREWVGQAREKIG